MIPGGARPATPTSPAPAIECSRAIKRLRWDRELAAIQREIDRVQRLGPGANPGEIDVLLKKKNDLAQRIEELQEKVRN